MDQQAECDYMIIVEIAVAFQNGFKWQLKQLIWNEYKTESNRIEYGVQSIFYFYAIPHFELYTKTMI